MICPSAVSKEDEGAQVEHELVVLLHAHHLRTVFNEADLRIRMFAVVAINNISYQVASVWKPHDSSDKLVFYGKVFFGQLMEVVNSSIWFSRSIQIKIKTTYKRNKNMEVDK